MQLTSSPLVHSRIEHADGSGFPAVSILISGVGVFEGWDAYRDTRSLGISSQRSYARSIGLFLDYCTAFGSRFLDQPERHKLFKAFADALIRGTVEDGGDPTGLYWLPRTRNLSGRIVSEVTEFSDWLAEDHGVKPLNPERRASVAEQIVFWRAWRQSSARSLLKHLKSAGHSGRRLHSRTDARMVNVRGSKPATPQGDKRAFPDQLFPDLLRNGFRRPVRVAWTTLRDQLIALLLHEGGLRLSEALHLWIDDVFVRHEDPASAVVRVYHPREGLRAYEDPVTGNSRTVTRAEYLRLAYGRAPLTELPGRKAVGWKEPLLTNATEKYMTVFWWSDDGARAFLEAYYRYVQLRPHVDKHPYLFIAEGGEPMGIRAYEKVHAAAVRRIGLAAAKNSGTTPHGHRHAYGLRLRRAGIPRKVRQVAMHHKSAFSQDVYTEADAAEVEKTLRALPIASDAFLLNFSLASMPG